MLLYFLSFVCGHASLLARVKMKSYICLSVRLMEACMEARVTKQQKYYCSKHCDYIIIIKQEIRDI